MLLLDDDNNNNNNNNNNNTAHTITCISAVDELFQLFFSLIAGGHNVI